MFHHLELINVTTSDTLHSPHDEHPKPVRLCQDQ